MATFSCEACQAELLMEVGPVLAHYTEVHPEYGLTERQVQNYLQRMPMLTGSTDRLDHVGDVEVVALGPQQVDDVLTFFDRDAFAGNPAWASCYCMAHHVPGGELGEAWGERTWEDNRRDLAERIETGTTTGVVAYEGGRVVGWCNASARCQYPDYARGQEDESTGVVTCFAVAPSHRGHGIARRMLEAVLERFPVEVDAIEAHPANDVNWPGAAYRGTLPLFEEHGFTVVHRGERATVVRREMPNQ